MSSLKKQLSTKSKSWDYFELHVSFSHWAKLGSGVLPRVSPNYPFLSNTVCYFLFSALYSLILCNFLWNTLYSRSFFTHRLSLPLAAYLSYYCLILHTIIISWSIYPSYRGLCFTCCLSVSQFIFNFVNNIVMFYLQKCTQ